MWVCPKCNREFKNTNQNHFCLKSENIKEYISAQTEEAQPFLQKIYDVVRNAAPDATEKISQYMPTFWQTKNLVQFAAHKNHVGFYPGDDAVTSFAERLAGYKTNKGCIHLPYDDIDSELIADIVRWRVANVNEKKAVSVPEELTAAMETDNEAKEFFQNLSDGYKRGYCDWVGGAKQAATRQTRADKALVMLLNKQKTLKT